MKKRYDDVSEMIKDLSSGNSFKDLAMKEIDKKRISKLLFLLRCRHNYTQEKLAGKIGCSQGRISKIESSEDKDISIKDLLDYAKALNLQLEIGYRHRSAKIVDLIKYHAFKIQEYLNQLSALAKDDETLNKSIAQFHGEALFNIGKIVFDSLSKLKIVEKIRPREKTPIHISPPLNDLDNLEKVDKLANQ